MSLFLGFTDTGRSKGRRSWEKDDLRRLEETVLLARISFLSGGALDRDVGNTPSLRIRFARLLIEAVANGVVTGDLLGQSLGVLLELVRKHPELVDGNYYAALSEATSSIGSHLRYSSELVEAVVSPLRSTLCGGPPYTDAAYRAFSSRYLTTPNLMALLGERGVGEIAAAVDVRRIAATWSAKTDTDGTLWLLAHVIYLSRHRKGSAAAAAAAAGDVSPLSAQGGLYIRFLSQLLSSVAVEVGRRIDVEDVTMGDRDHPEGGDDGGSTKPKKEKKKEPLPAFVKEQLESLVQQSSVFSMLSSVRSTDGNANVLAGFALNLLLIFPAHRTDMRLWLCVAVTADGVPAVRYMWNAVKRCQLFHLVRTDAAKAVNYLKLPSSLRLGSSEKSAEDQWSLIFLFLAIYSFVLFTGDDHEFLQGKGRQLPLAEVTELSLFLKNLAFALYWWFAEIMGDDQMNDKSGEVFFNTQEEPGRAWELDYFRTVVTDVLKAIYARE